MKKHSRGVQYTAVVSESLTEKPAEVLWHGNYSLFPETFGEKTAEQKTGKTAAEGKYSCGNAMCVGGLDRSDSRDSANKGTNDNPWYPDTW